MPKGIKGFQKGHKLFPGGKLFGSGQKMFKQLKGKESIRWKGGTKASAKRKYEKNKGKYRMYVIKRRALKRNAEGTLTNGEWETLKVQYGFICPCCKEKEPKIKLEIDHIIPLSKGGSNFVENIQPLCRVCNAKKHTKIIKYPYLEY